MTDPELRRATGVFEHGDCIRCHNPRRLFETGIVNSLFAVQLMTFVEKTFAIEVEMEDLDIENFKSLNATAAFVMRKTGRRDG